MSTFCDLFHEHSNIILGYVSGKQWKCRFTKIDTSPVKMSLEKILCKMWYVSNSFRPKIFSKHQINVWWLSFSTRNTQGTFYNLFREHPTIILEYMSRNVWSCEFLGFQHPIFDASFDDILKIKDLQIFKIQRPLEKKVYIQWKNGLHLRLPRVDELPRKKRIRSIVPTVFPLDGHMCVHHLTHI